MDYGQQAGSGARPQTPFLVEGVFVFGLGVLMRWVGSGARGAVRHRGGAIPDSLSLIRATLAVPRGHGLP